MAKSKDDAVRRSTDPVKKAENEKQGVFQRIKKWFTELKVELKKVVWPTKSQTINNTLVALAVIVAASIVIWGFDELATMGVKAIIALV